MNEQIVSKNSFNEMISRQINIEDDISYGYGQVIREHKANGRMIYEVGHFGGMPGFCSYMSMYPESKTSIILLSNLDADNIGEIVGFLKEQVINSL